ncbi:DUF1641 domain-containing protein [Psychrobacillus sp. NPDC096426]|uniref:DUF1641 domain-containing protein n=1 Tax=Psychrobacillus sp. NPDC096426 TaxID=3364491 RepID=UPI0037F59EE5
MTDMQKKDLLDQLLDPQVQQSLTTLVNELPKLTEMMTMLTKAYDVAQTLAQDKVFTSDMINATTEIVGPVVKSAKGLAATAIEAKDRMEISHKQIGLFGMLKLLKDPQVQGVLRFANAFLEVNKENKEHS